MKNEKFTKEINEAIDEINVSSGQSDTLETLQGSKDTNEVLATHNTGTNDNGGQGKPIERTKELDAFNADEDATKGGKNESEEKVKDGRGRKPLSDEEKAVRAAERALNKDKNATAQKSLVDDLSKYKTVASPTATTTAAAPQNVEIDLSKYISGALLLIVLDAVFPSLILLIMGMVDKRYKGVSKEVLKLTKEEKKELEPLAEQMIKLMFGFVHPAVAFFACTTMLYAGKLMSIDDEELNAFNEKKIIDNKNVKKK